MTADFGQGRTITALPQRCTAVCGTISFRRRRLAVNSGPGRVLMHSGGILSAEVTMATCLAVLLCLELVAAISVVVAAVTSPST